MRILEFLLKMEIDSGFEYDNETLNKALMGTILATSNGGRNE